MSDLINVYLNDKSATVSPIVGLVGAATIKANKGSDEPILFYPKSRTRLLNYLGIPDTDAEAVQDVVDYNDKFPIWVSAPSSGGKYGGVIVTKTGTVPFLGGKDSKVINFAEIDVSEIAQTMNGEVSEVSFTLSKYDEYVNQSLDILVNGVSIAPTVSNAEPEVITSTVGSGTYTRTTGAFLFTFDEVPAQGTVITLAYKVDESATAYFVIFNKNAQVDDLKAKVVKNTDNDFVIDISKKSLSSTQYNTLPGFPKTASTVLNKRNGFQQNIYMPVLFQDDDFIEVVVNTSLAFSTYTDDAAYVSFAGGVRGTTATSDLTRGWAYFQNSKKYKADVFFDCSADSAIPAIFNTLSTSYQKYAYYIFITPNVSVENAITAMVGVIPDNKALACYWGWGKIKNQYTDILNACSLMGRRALRLAEMYDIFNGLAPAWYNENGRHGGQLGSGIVEMFFDANDTQQAALEAARINPTIMHSVFGVVNTRERTGQSLLSDYASIGHVRLMQYLVSNIIDQALPYQLYKLNDNGHRTTVAAQIDKIIAPTASEPYNLLREYAVKCDAENNDDDVLAREEFVVSVAVKFTPFSKKIFLYFTNSAQGTSVTEDV